MIQPTFRHQIVSNLIFQGHHYVKYVNIFFEPIPVGESDGESVGTFITLLLVDFYEFFEGMYVCMYVCDSGSRGFHHTRASRL